jgi:hypothetical protein
VYFGNFGLERKFAILGSEEDGQERIYRCRIPLVSIWATQRFRFRFRFMTSELVLFVVGKTSDIKRGGIAERSLEVS